MFCGKCGTALREGALFCPECGLSTENTPPPIEEYIYETVTNLFPWKAVIPIVFAVWLPLTGIGLMVAMTEGFWFVPFIMSGVVLLGVFGIAWGYKGKQKKWGKDRTLWVITPYGWCGGYPPDVAKRLAALGAFSASTTFGRENWGVTSQGINMAMNIKTVIHGLPVNMWIDYIKAEYRPAKLEIALYKPTGMAGLIRANPDNYTAVEQLVRRYMRGIL